MPTIITVRGATEPMTGNMLSWVISQLPGYNHVELPYSASISIDNADHNPFETAGTVTVTDCVAMMNTTVAQYDSTVILAYSLGALCVEQWLKQLPAQLVSRVQLVVLMADPSRPVGKAHGNVSVGSGVCTDTTFGSPFTGTTPFPVLHFASPDDVITSCPDPSLVRYLAGPLMSWDFTNGGPEETALQADLMTALAQVQDQDAIQVIATVPQAMASIGGFFSGAHTTAYSGEDNWTDDTGKKCTALQLMVKAVKDIVPL